MARCRPDAAIALGKIGEKSSLATLAEIQRTAPRESQPAIAAAICLLGVNCESHEPYLANTLRFAIATIGYQELVRGSAAGLASLAVTGREAAAAELIRQGARHAIRPVPPSCWRSARSRCGIRR